MHLRHSKPSVSRAGALLLTRVGATPLSLLALLGGPLHHQPPLLTRILGAGLLHPPLAGILRVGVVALLPRVSARKEEMFHLLLPANLGDLTLLLSAGAFPLPLVLRALARPQRPLEVVAPLRPLLPASTRASLVPPLLGRVHARPPLQPFAPLVSPRPGPARWLLLPGRTPWLLALLLLSLLGGRTPLPPLLLVLRLRPQLLLLVPHHQGVELGPVLRPLLTDHAHRLLRVLLLLLPPPAHRKVLRRVGVARPVVAIAALRRRLLLPSRHPGTGRKPRTAAVARATKDVVRQLIRPLPLLLGGHPQLDKLVQRRLPLPPLHLLLFGPIAPFLAAL